MDDFATHLEHVERLRGAAPHWSCACRACQSAARRDGPAPELAIRRQWDPRSGILGWDGSWILVVYHGAHRVCRRRVGDIDGSTVGDAAIG